MGWYLLDSELLIKAALCAFAKGKYSTVLVRATSGGPGNITVC